MDFFHTWLLFLAYFSPIFAQKDASLEFKAVLKDQEFVAALFTKECCACTECVEAEAVFEALQHEITALRVIPVKLVNQPKLEKQYGVSTWPTLLLFRRKEPVLYTGQFSPDEVPEWLEKARESSLVELNDETFEHLTQASTGATTGDWLVSFMDSSCNSEIKPTLEGLAVHFKNRANIAWVDRQKSIETVKRFRINQCPQVIFLRQGKLYLYEGTVEGLKAFLEGGFQNSKHQKVPLPKSNLDEMLDSMIKDLKGNLTTVILVLCGAFLFIGACSIIVASKKGLPKEKTK